MVVAAPPLASDDWLTSEPISWNELQGRFALLSFWSAECEASLGYLQELEKLNDQWPELVVIAVHSPRAPYARDRQMVMSVLDRHGISVNVLHDPALETWSRYNPSGWPASVLLDPAGKAIGATAGAGVGDLLADVLEFHEPSADEPQRDRPTVAASDGTTAVSAVNSPLRWPGSVTALADGRIAVADSGNRRILIGTVSSGSRSDGGAEAAQLSVRQIVSGIGDIGEIHSPSANVLLVARPAAGEVWQVDLAAHKARPIITDLDRPIGLTTDLDRSVVVTDAGRNQIVRLAADGSTGVIAGNGVFGSHDGPAGRSSLAQPVSIASINAGLCFIDAASNNVRILTKRGRVASVTHNDTTTFGLVDGAPHQARFQRPTAVLPLSDHSLLVSDTGNSRVRQITDRAVKTIGANDLCRPEGMAELADGTIIVADTGNHRLVILDLKSRSTRSVTVSHATTA